MAMTETKIISDLDRFFSGNARYKVPNAYIFKSDWETDFFVQKPNGYCYEFEIKITKADFKADEKKQIKHSILKHGFYQKITKKLNPDRTGWEDRYIDIESQEVHALRPNRFFYVVPTGMIGPHDIPEYAGLYYYQEMGFPTFTKIVEGPLIHNEKLKLSHILAPKFYAYWQAEKLKSRLLQMDLDQIKNNKKPRSINQIL